MRFGFLGQQIDCTVHWHLHTADPGGWGCYAHLSGRPFDPIHLSQPGKPGTPARRPSDPTPFLSVKPYNSVNTRKQIAHARTKRPQRTAQNLQQFLIFFACVCVLCESFARGQLFIWAGSAARRHTQVHTHTFKYYGAHGRAYYLCNCTDRCAAHVREREHTQSTLIF